MPRTVWYPGHMAKGTKKLFELASKLDILIEVKDARAPGSTSAPFMNKINKIKPVIKVLSHKDLTDENKLKLWLENKNTFAADLRSKSGINNIKRAILKFKPAHRELRLAVAGIPNVGKSLLLNALIGKSSANVGGVPGVTKSVSWYKNDGMLIVDSPGILDPHAEPGVHLILSWLGCAKAEVIGGYESSALELIKFLIFKDMAEIIPVENNNNLNPGEILELIGKKYGCLISGGHVNFELAGRKFIEAFSSGRLGKFCLEIPGEDLAINFNSSNLDLNKNVH